MIARSHSGAPSDGNGAPDRSHRGIRKTVMTAWNPCVDSMRQAMQNDRAVRANATATRIRNDSPRTVAVSLRPARGASTRRTSPCATARTVPPSTLPRTKIERGTGATRTDCRKPSRRSSMTDTVEKMAVNSRIITTTPGKKYSPYATDPPATGGGNEAPRPQPDTAPDTKGGRGAPKTPP